MSVVPLRAFQDNYIWAIVNPQTQTMVCIDPGEATPVLDYANHNTLRLTYILLTHHHHDHIGGVEALVHHYPKAMVYGPADSRVISKHVIAHDTDVITMNDLSFRVLSIPGHTRSHICFYELTQGWLFCGDTLFSAGCGRVFDGTIEELYDSMQRLKQLPEDTKVYCGHEYTLQNLRFASLVDPNNTHIQSYRSRLQQQANACSLPSTLALEKKINPFMRTDLPEIQAFAKANGAASTEPLAVFKLLREKKDAFVYP